MMVSVDLRVEHGVHVHQYEVRIVVVDVGKSRVLYVVPVEICELAHISAPGCRLFACCSHADGD